jgi:mRNA interferase MazF
MPGPPGPPKPRRGEVWTVDLDPALAAHSYVKCEDVRSLSIRRLRRRLGSVSDDTLRAVEERLRLLMRL